MKELYATSEEIHAEIQQLEARCKFLRKLYKIVLQAEEDADIAEAIKERNEENHDHVPRLNLGSPEREP